jgi:hypothetical protein
MIMSHVQTQVPKRPYNLPTKSPNDVVDFLPSQREWLSFVDKHELMLVSNPKLASPLTNPSPTQNYVIFHSHQ